VHRTRLTRPGRQMQPPRSCESEEEAYVWPRSTVVRSQGILSGASPSNPDRTLRASPAVSPHKRRPRLVTQQVEMLAAPSIRDWRQLPTKRLSVENILPLTYLCKATKNCKYLPMRDTRKRARPLSTFTSTRSAGSDFGSMPRSRHCHSVRSLARTAVPRADGLSACPLRGSAV
jgi:hypothetical protein